MMRFTGEKSHISEAAALTGGKRATSCVRFRLAASFIPQGVD